MGSFSDEAAKAVKGSLCALVAAQDGATRFFNGLAGIDGDFLNVAGSLRRTMCNDDTPAENPYDPPFTGGQCAGVTYAFQAFSTGEGSWRPVSFATNNLFTGPIEGIQFVNSYPAEVPPGTTCSAIKVTYAGGQTRTSFGCEYQTSVITGLRFVRADNAPDTCGDPAPIVPPYEPQDINIDIEYQNNEGDTVTENYNLNIFAPIISGNGVIYAPITLNGTVNFKGTLELSPEFKLQIGPNNIGSPTINVGGDPPPPENPPPEVPPDVEGAGIIGVIVSVTDATGGTSSRIAQGSNPDIYAPGLGYINFQISTSKGKSWLSDIPVKNTRNYIPCPVDFGAIAVRGTPRAGYAFTLNPVFRENLAPQP